MTQLQLIKCAFFVALSVLSFLIACFLLALGYVSLFYMTFK